MPSLPSLHRRAAALCWLAAVAAGCLSLPAQAHAQKIVAAAASTPAGQAPLLGPTSVAYDDAGNLYFAESRNHVVRRVDSAGILTTVAGSATQGFAGDGGVATNASLDSPRGVALDAAQNLYVADTRNHRVRRVDAVTHVITTVAGTGSAGFSGDGSLATAAHLSLPLALALDGADHLLIADSGNHRIRSVDLTTGIITTVAGNGRQGFSGDGGVATAAALDTPSGLAADPFGNLFIADTGNHRIREVSAASRAIITLAGDGSSGIRFNRPEGLSLDRTGGLLVADAASHRVYLLIIATGKLTVVAGQGTQSFAGDHGLATLAMLDSPSGIAVSPSGLLVVADTENRRVRQISSESAGTIVTIAGLGTVTTSALALSGPSSQTYGSASLAATFASGLSGSGQVSLLDTTSSSPILLLSSPISAGVAAFDLSALPAGMHQLVATYAGDPGHSAAQTSVLSLTLAPLPLIAAAELPALVYGQSLPPITGVLSGVLPRDSANLSVSFTAQLPPLPSAGSYPLTVRLSGSAAPNYVLSSGTASLVIAKAPALVTLAHQQATLALQVASTTAGTPSGAVSLVTAAGTQLASVPLSAAGTITLADAGLTPGSYTLTAVYSGDANFLAARSAPSAVEIGSGASSAQPADFSFVASGTSSVTLNAGETASFTFNLKTSGAPLAGPISLASSGLPSFATGAFNPPVIPPGGAVQSFTLSVNTPRALSQRIAPASSSRLGILAFAALIPPIVFRRRLSPRHRAEGSPSPLLRAPVLLSTAFCFVALLALTGCGARVNSAGVSAKAAAQSYAITITGTSTNLDGSTLQRTSTVNLTVQ